MSVHPSLAPRRRNCIVCREAADVADVNLRLFDAEGNRLGLKDATDFLRASGMTGADGTIKARLTAHRRHVEQFLRAHDAPPAIAPALHVLPAARGGQVTRLGEREDATWLSLQQTGMNITREAWALVQARLPEAEFNELVSLVRLGSTIAAKRADLEFKGRIQRSADRMRIASGLEDGKPG